MLQKLWGHPYTIENPCFPPYQKIVGVKCNNMMAKLCFWKTSSHMRLNNKVYMSLQKSVSKALTPNAWEKKVRETKCFPQEKYFPSKQTPLNPFGDKENRLSWPNLIHRKAFDPIWVSLLAHYRSLCRSPKRYFCERVLWVYGQILIFVKMSIFSFEISKVLRVFNFGINFWVWTFWTN